VARGWIHTVHKVGRWVNEVEEGDEISSHWSRQAAVAVGRRQAEDRRTEHVIHNVDGTVAEQSSYGPDPFPPPA
jgi:hypothetical protein